MRRHGSLYAAISLMLAVLLTAIAYSSDPSRLSYPPAMQDSTEDVYYEMKVRDPYRWLENPDSPETVRWVELENRLSAEFFNSNPDRQKLQERLTKLWNYERFTVPWKKGNHYFFYRNAGLQNQYVLYMQKSLQDKPRIVLDPNTFSSDGTVSLSSISSSMDGKMLAYGLSTGGSDWEEFKIRDIESGRDFDEVLTRCRFSSIAWKPDNSGFFYNRYPDKGSVPQEEEVRFNRVYWHKLNTPQSEDRLIYGESELKDMLISPHASEDGAYLFLTVSKGTDPRNRVCFRRMDSDGEFLYLFDKNKARYRFLDNIGSTFFFYTDLDAPKGRVISIDAEHRSQFREIIPEQPDAISDLTFVNNQFAVVYRHDACAMLKLYDRNGTFLHNIALPGIGSVHSVSGRKEDREMFFSYSSYISPTTIYRYDFQSSAAQVLHRPKIRFSQKEFETEQVFYSSKDGTKVPMFITHRKGIKHDGRNPALLYGYGGFSYSLSPRFSLFQVLWLEQGGIYAEANIRGGDEYGEEWHWAGALDRKQNVFDDFIAAAEWLIANKYTSRERLAINGASNGGLLVAACMVQRPDLFGAVVCEVPLTDMLRYHKFTMGHFWESEYGNAEKSADEFATLYSYSPLHNVRPGISYPATLVMTADYDDRVVAAHSEKFVAALQASDSGANPILLRVESKAGHGAGKPTSKYIEERSDVLSFLFKVLGIKYTEPE